MNAIRDRWIAQVQEGIEQRGRSESGQLELLFGVCDARSG
jgi:hypothetical protein